ncbi:MAG TPA: O-antigen ligase family protein, partial [Verrucomicrobiae bacterium]
FAAVSVFYPCASVSIHGKNLPAKMVLTRKNLDWWCERGILSLVLGMLVFAPLAFGAVDTWAFLVVQIAAAAVFILWGARLWLNPRGKLLWPPLAWVVLAFMAYAVVRHFTADIEYVARLETIQVLLFGFLFFAVLNNLRGQEEISIVSGTLIAVGAFTACYAVVQLTRNSNVVWNQVSPYLNRASGTYISPNNLSCLLAMLLPLALAYLLVGKVNIVTRILLGYAALAMAAGLAVTFSRGGWIAAAAGIILLLGILLGHGNHRLKAAVLLAVILLGGGFLTSHYLSKTFGYMRRVAAPDEAASLQVVDTSADSRLLLWRSAVQMWTDYPWCGVGPGHYDYRFREYRPEWVQGRPDRVHNDYLNLLADWGAVGGGIVLVGIGIFIFWLRKTWPHVRREENDFGSGQSNRFAFFIGAVCGLAALAVHSAMDFNLHIPANALVGVVLLALVASNARYATEQFWFRPQLPLKLILATALGMVAIYFLAQAWRLGGEAYWLAQADEQPIFSVERTAALKKAFACESKNFATAYAIGECYRLQSQAGDGDAIALGEESLAWYARAIRLNPHDGYSFLRTGMCLDLLDRSREAEPAYRAAEARDPNGYYTLANIGWHYVQTGDYAAAQEWFNRSMKLDWNNDIAKNYLAICQSKLAAKAAEKSPLPSGY